MIEKQVETYDRRPFSDWIVETIDIDPEQFEGFYRTTYRDGKECEQFTLLPKDSDDVLLQIRVFKNGDILVGNFVPANVVVYKRKKRITIEFLCYIEMTNDGMRFIMKEY